MQKNENFVHCITPTVNVFRITFCFIQPLIGRGGGVGFWFAKIGFGVTNLFISWCIMKIILPLYIDPII